MIILWREFMKRWKGIPAMFPFPKTLHGHSIPLSQGMSLLR